MNALHMSLFSSNEELNRNVTSGSSSQVQLSYVKLSYLQASGHSNVCSFPSGPGGAGGGGVTVSFSGAGHDTSNKNNKSAIYPRQYL